MTPPDALPVPPPDEAACLAVAGLLCASVGVPWDPAAAIAALRASTDLDPRWGALLELAQPLGLRLSPDSGDLDELGARVRPDLPALLRTPEGGLVLLSEVNGRFARVGRADHAPRWVRRSVLERTLGHGTLTWLWVEPLAPAAALLGAAPGAEGEHRSATERLWAVLDAEREDLRIVLLYAVGVGVLSLGTPLAVQVLINTVAFGALRQPIAVLALLLAATLILGAVLKALQRVVVEVLQRRVFVRLVADLAWRLPRVRVDALERARGPELVNRFFDVVTVQKAASSLLLDGLAAALQALVGLALLALYHPLLLAFDLVLLGAIGVLLFGLGGKAPATAIYESKAKYLVAGWLEELALHSRAFRQPGGADWATRQADLLACGYLTARDQHFKVYFRQYVGVLALQVIAGTALLAGGGLLVLERQLTLGQLVAAELIVATALTGVAKVSEKLDGFYDLLAALDKLGQLIEQPLERQTGRPLVPADRPAALSLEGLALGVGAVAPLTLELDPGEAIAVLGGGGAGKTRLGEVLAGLRAPAAGRALLDGQDVQELRLADLRRAVCVVERVEIIDGTLDQNLGLDRPDLGPEQRRAALDAVGLAPRVAALAQGADTPLGERGAPLSELDAARLVLARALLARPRLLVVDGLLDRFPPEDRVALLAVLREGPWTLLLCTRDPALAQELPMTLSLPEGRVGRASPWRTRRSPDAR